MKSLFVLIPILLILAISPFLFEDAFADHVPRNSGGFYDHEFYMQEVDNTNGNCETYGHGDLGGIIVQTLHAGSAKYCTLFKSFDQVDLHGNVMTFNDGFTTWSRTNGVATYITMKIFDGEYIAGNSTDFPSDAPLLTKGAGQLYTSGFTIPAPDNPTEALDLSASTSSDGKVTVFFAWLEDLSGAGTSTFQMSTLDISNLGKWVFCTGTDTHCDSTNPDSGRLGSGQLEYATMYSYEFHDEWIRDIPPTDLSATVLNATAVKFDWTETDDAGIGLQGINTGLNVTGYYLEIKNGTSGESDYWTMANQTIGDVETTNLYTLLEAGHGYTARLLTTGFDGNILSEGSNEITFTMDGASVTTETYDESYSHTNDSTDSRFYYRELTGDAFFSGFLAGFPGYCPQTEYSIFSPSDGYWVDTDDSSPQATGQCMAIVKVFPSADVMDVEWTFNALWHRSIDQTYHSLKIYDGAYDVYNGTLGGFVYEGDFQQQRDRDGTRLYNDGGSTSPDVSFTPTGATQEFVTLIVELEDRTANDVSVRYSKLDIAGYDTFYIANTEALQLSYPSVDYIDGTEHDWGWVNALYTPQPVVLSIEASGDGNDAILSWVDPNVAGTFALEPTGYKIEKQCPSGAGWKTFVADTGDLLTTYTDVNFLAETGVSFADDFTVNDWTHTDEQAPDFITVNADPTDGYLHFNTLVDSADTRSYKPLGFTLDDESWVMEFKLNWDELAQGTGGNYWYVGVVDNEFLSVETQNNDFIGLNVLHTYPDHKVYFFDKNFSAESRSDTGFSFDDEHEELDVWFWVQIARISATDVTVKISSQGNSFDEDNLVLDYINTTVPSATINLDNVYVSNAILSVGNEAEMGGRISDLRIGDGSTYMQDTEETCVYRVTATNPIGGSVPSNEASITAEGVTLTSPGELSCTSSSTSSADLVWSYDGEETAEGFRIDGSTPVGSSFVNLQNTTGTSTLQTVTGLLEDKEYQFKVAVLVDPDTSGFSNVATCRTNTSGGSGGSPGVPSTPSEPVVTVDPVTGEDTVSGDSFETVTPSTPISEEQSALFDLSFPLIQELTNTFSGDIFTLVGAKHSAGLGQTIEGELLVGWNNQENVLISSVIVAPTQLSVIPNPLPPYIAEGGSILSDNQIKQLSIIPPTSPNIKSHQLIPYSITIPGIFCGVGITEECVEPGTHKIPIKVVSTQGGQNVANTARIEVAVGIPTIQFDIPTFVLIALISVAIIGGIQVARKIKSKKKGVKHV